MTPILFSAAKSSDLEQLNRLMFGLHHEHHQSCPDFFKTAREIEQEKSIARYLDDPECLVFVAKDKQDVVGFITGHFCELVSSVSKPIQMGSVDELYVLPQYRQRKIAHQLCETLNQRFKEYGVVQIFVEVWDFNATALEFYNKLGFEHHIHWLRKAI
ncbi:GNAT family N-acetyltransferase [Vibrio genomosp. F10]|uniref:Histone acetyltransferase n=2 Tax=Vibrio genomosp. F10 TaxID=723171 RepID=A0A1B9QXE2_9VIBR|nr:GNAT family N-acetyltransferase [Vibrio genomosp. F10]OCH74682.1 histone acetyltransferase [Vibrio genomosp. F10]OEE30630.1 histone acetyltransferase [Vibrio genomosp. F10 str. ZF-129]OEE96643.1 histone acetyltransferase [Vibrio genomosp. F10 str. 9ZC157]OEF06679.1 histone acetyltransferase [Vibrio genomosp. F10 str. 9ZB36]OEF12619.1 histone acetyltransferase [Vibrio genomosp. F10 str. 9ZD137]